MFCYGYYSGAVGALGVVANRPTTRSVKARDNATPINNASTVQMVPISLTQPLPAPQLGKRLKLTATQGTLMNMHQRSTQ